MKKLFLFLCIMLVCSNVYAYSNHDTTLVEISKQEMINDWNVASKTLKLKCEHELIIDEKVKNIKVIVPFEESMKENANNVSNEKLIAISILNASQHNQIVINKETREKFKKCILDMLSYDSGTFYSEVHDKTYILERSYISDYNYKNKIMNVIVYEVRAFK